VLSKGEGKTTSFVGANFTRAQLRRLPTDGTHAGPGRSNIWLTHMHGTVVHRKLRFGPFELSIGERVLRRDGRVLPLGDRALDILTYLADHPGEVIAKQQLMDRVWADVTVEEGSLRVHVAAIRKALGDGQFGNRYIANIKGRGYSFVGTVVPLAGGTENGNSKFPPKSGSPRDRS
jgi:DNA-binding winged helix-turn-helix (wHTH) protein